MTLDEIARLRAENERLAKERDNWKAHAISRGKRLRQARDKFINIRNEIEDEGDRVYFGSSNHADQFKEEVAWLDNFAWDKIMGEPEDWDLLGALEKQKARAEAAEAERDDARLGWSDEYNRSQRLKLAADKAMELAAASLTRAAEFCPQYFGVGKHIADAREALRAALAPMEKNG